MPRTDLPSKQPDGSQNWVEYRDRLSVQDRIAANSAVKFTFEAAPDGKGEVRKVTGGNDERMKVALAAQVITAWSFPGIPVPSQNIADPEELIASTLDLDDWDAVSEAIDPLFQRILGAAPKPAETAPQEAPEETPQAPPMS